MVLFLCALDAEKEIGQVVSGILARKREHAVIVEVGLLLIDVVGNLSAELESVLSLGPVVDVAESQNIRASGRPGNRIGQREVAAHCNLRKVRCPLPLVQVRTRRRSELAQRSLRNRCAAAEVSHETQIRLVDRIRIKRPSVAHIHILLPPRVVEVGIRSAALRHDVASLIDEVAGGEILFARQADIELRQIFVEVIRTRILIAIPLVLHARGVRFVWRRHILRKNVARRGVPHRRRHKRAARRDLRGSARHWRAVHSSARRQWSSAEDRILHPRIRAEIAGLLLRGSDHHAGMEVRSDLPQSIVRSEEKYFVLANRAAERSSVLIAMQCRGCARAERRIRVQDRVAHEFKYRSVQIVRAGLGDHVHDSRSGAPVFGVVIVRLHAEFLNRIRARDRIARIANSGLVQSAVKVIAHRAGAAIGAAIDHGHLLLEADSRVRERRRLHARSQLQQRVHVAPDDRKVLDLCIVHGSANFGIRGVHSRRRARHVHGFADAADRQRHVHGRDLVNREHHAFLVVFFEAGRGHVQNVIADRKQIESVLSRSIRLAAPRESGVRIRNLHLRVHNGRAGVVGHGAYHSCSCDLSEAGCRETQNENNNDCQHRKAPSSPSRRSSP